MNQTWEKLSRYFGKSNLKFTGILFLVLFIIQIVIFATTLLSTETTREDLENTISISKGFTLLIILLALIFSRHKQLKENKNA